MRTASFMFAVLIISLLPVSTALCARDILNQMALSGDWQPELSTSGVAQWLISKDGCAVTLPPKRGPQEYSLVGTEPLPDSDWSIDFWVAYGGSMFSANITCTFFIGRAGPRSLELSFKPEGDRLGISGINGRVTDAAGARRSFLCDSQAGGGPIHWFHLAHSKQAGTLTVSLDGRPQQFYCDEKRSMELAGIDISRGPVGFRVSSNWLDGEQVFHLASFQVFAESGKPPALPSPAVQGWHKPLVDISDTIPGLDSRLTALCGTPGISARTKASLLGAIVLRQKASTGQVSAAIWTQVATLVEACLPEERGSAIELLPIAVACANRQQREDAARWVEKLYYVNYVDDWRRIRMNPEDYGRSCLLDQEKGATLIAVTRMGTPSAINDIPSSLASQRPDLMLGLYTAEISQANSDPKAIAWLLPDISKISRNYYALASQYLNQYGRYALPGAKSPDIIYSFAAYRMATVDVASALRYADLIKAPDIKAETLEYIAGVASVEPGGSLDHQIEENLKAAIAAVTSLPKKPSPIPTMIRLIKWYSAHGRPKDAEAVLNQAVDSAGQASEVSAGNALGIARAMKELKLPSAAEWWKKAEETAIADDAKYLSSNGGSGDIYISALNLMVRDLLKEDRIDEALQLAERIDPALTVSRGMSMGSIVSRLSATNVPRALELIKNQPDAKWKRSALSTAAAQLAKSDLKGALSLLDGIPQENRTDALLRITTGVAVDSSPELLEACRQAVVSGMAPRPQGLFPTSSAKSKALIGRLPLPSLLRIAESNARSLDSVAHSILVSVGNKSGLPGDPLWQAYLECEKEQDASIPWGPDSLRYAVKATE